MISRMIGWKRYSYESITDEIDEGNFEPLSWPEMKRKVVDSVSEFPYACAVQYRQIRGRTLLPGSGRDRVFPRRFGRHTETWDICYVYNLFGWSIFRL